jgi:ATP-binding cassette, subfamily B, bacterial MsbA
MKVLDRLLGGFLNPSGPLRPIASRYAWSIPVVGGLSIVAGVLEGFGIGFLIPLLSSLSSTAPSDSFFVGLLEGVAGGIPPDIRLVAIGAIVLVLIMCKGLVEASAEMIVTFVDGHVSHEIRSLIARSYTGAGYRYFLALGHARLVNALNTESWMGSEVIRIGFQVIISFVTVVVFSLLLVLTHWQLFLVAAAGAGLIRLFQTAFSARVARLSEAVQRANVDLARRMMLVAFETVKLVRVFNEEEKEATRFEASSDRLRRATTKVARRVAWIGPISEVLYGILFLGILIGAYMNGVSLPVLIAFLILMYRMQPHVRAIATAGASIAGVTASVREIEAVVAAARDYPPPGGARSVDGLGKGIEFRDVGYVYDAEKGGSGTLKFASFNIRAGRWVALIGPSGSGKSTIVNLICKLLTPAEGKILVDGVDLAVIDTIDWRAHVGLAGQDLDLFDGTIAENIAFGCEGVKEEAITAAALLVGLHSFVSGLPNAYQTIVGDRGLALSGGQRQRVGLARALVRKPSLLILDEATNAIDAASESEIMRGLRALDDPITVIVISHRPSTLVLCDDTIELGEAAVEQIMPGQV